ncbi:MAG: response regulator [Nitrospinota bacterium]
MNRGSILIVDDVDFAREGLAKILSEEGFSVHTACDGEFALTETRKRKYDLIITDIKMDGLDGIELTRRIKKKNPIQHIIVMTAYGDIDSYLDAMNLGSFDYINKPFTSKELIRIVNKAFEKIKTEELKAEEFDTT